MFRNAEYIINRKRFESIDYVGITTIVKNLLEFSDSYSRSAATNIFWYKDETKSVDSFKAENEFEITFTPVAACGETIKTKRNNASNSGLFKRFNKTKESHMVSTILPLSRFFGFLQNIHRIFRGVTHQIISKSKDFSNMTVKSRSPNF